MFTSPSYRERAGRGNPATPRRAMIDRPVEVEPGDTVRMTFSREGEERTARVVTESGPALGTFDREGLYLRGLAHVRAILASYHPGKEIAFGIMREKRTREVTGIRRSARAPVPPPAAPPEAVPRD